jgi:photosystem II stability/assembly factor-like uncharacterized protein
VSRFIPLSRRLAATAFLSVCLGAGLTLAAAPAEAPRSLLLDGVELAPGGTIVAVGERGLIALSADAGQTWSAATSPTRATLTGVTFAPDGSRGWAVGHDALILTSADRGRTWAKQWQGENLEDSLLDVLALDVRHVLAVGAYGLFLASTDGGATWTRRKLNDDDLHFNRITAAPGGRLYLAGERGTLLASDDRGASWAKLAAPYEGSFYGVLALDDRTLLAYGLRGHVFRSRDGGQSWTQVPLAQPAFIATAARTADRRIFLAGQARSLFVSDDDAATFGPASVPPTMAVAELLALPSGGLLALGENGRLRIEPAKSPARAP